MIGRLVIGLLAKILCHDWERICVHLDAVCLELDRSPDIVPPLIAQRLLVSGEDHRHAHHSGFDVIAIGRAVWRRISRGVREGASTIEQQTVRVITGRYERTVTRKIREILLAILVTGRYPKYRLPAAYLCIGYFGWRMNGYRQACRRLGLSPNSISFEEASKLVARLKYPQPRDASPRRMFEIHRRARHLQSLYARHISDGTYRHIDGSAFCNRTPTRTTVSRA